MWNIHRRFNGCLHHVSDQLRPSHKVTVDRHAKLFSCWSCVSSSSLINLHSKLTDFVIIYWLTQANEIAFIIFFGKLVPMNCLQYDVPNNEKKAKAIWLWCAPWDGANLLQILSGFCEIILVILHMTAHCCRTPTFNRSIV